MRTPRYRIHLFVADRDNHRIQVFDASGNFLFKWGSSGSGDGQFNLPHGIAVGPGNYVYVADSLARRKRKLVRRRVN